MKSDNSGVFPFAVNMHFCEIDSTNSFVKRWLRHSVPPEGTLVRADYQTTGRGQRGRSWSSRPGEGFLGTMILYPEIEPNNHFILAMTFALGIYQTIKTIGGFGETDRIQLKWPNDVLADGYKIAGILTESAIQNDKFSWYIAGCGINLNGDHVGSDDEGISLRKLTGQYYHPGEVGDCLRLTLAPFYQMIRDKNYKAIKIKYKNVLAGTREVVTFTGKEGVEITGIIKSVNNDGTLIVDAGGTRELKVTYGEWRIGKKKRR